MLRDEIFQLGRVARAERDFMPVLDEACGQGLCHVARAQNSDFHGCPPWRFRCGTAAVTAFTSVIYLAAGMEAEEVGRSALLARHRAQRHAP